MLRAEIVDADQPLKLVTTATVPSPPPGGARIRTTYAGVCHSDLHHIHDEVNMGNGVIMRRRDIFPQHGKLS